ncbi:MAG: S8 family serine peptidase [Verrucomicrobiota bacterium]
MKLPKSFWVLFALAILGGYIGFYISNKGSLSIERSEPDASTGDGESQQVVFDFPEMSPESPVGIDLKFPKGAMDGELVVHLTNREDYLAYIAALNATGTKPLGQIDELFAVRIPEGALLSVNLDQYDARVSYSYEVERPLPPVQLDPAALASLRPFDFSAREIVNGLPEGDGSDVVVAILDSGIEAHPQFRDVDIVNMDLAGSGVSGPGAAHGTSVASIIAGKEGIAPNAELFVVRVLDDQGLGNSYDVAEGIVQAVDYGVQIINLSLGVYQDTPLLRQAVQYAAQNDVILVAAAGNDGYARMPYPAAYDEVLSVTALDAGGRQAVFPNQSDEIDFAAPGVGIRTANEDEGTTLFSGTSAAAPFVSGTLASLMSGDNAMTTSAAVELMQRYLNDAGAPGTDPVYGDGAVDWDRLRERSQTGILDIALADIYLSQDALPGTTMPVEVTVQNRGTKWFNDAELEVMIEDADPLSFSIGTLGPGQITTRKVFTQIPSLGSDDALSLVARVLPEDLNEDIRLENNLKAVQFRPR